MTVQNLELELEAYHVQSVRVEYSLETVTQHTGPVGIAQIKGFKYRNSKHSFYTLHKGNMKSVSRFGRV